MCCVINIRVTTIGRVSFLVNLSVIPCRFFFLYCGFVILFLYCSFVTTGILISNLVGIPQDIGCFGLDLPVIKIGHALPSASGQEVHTDQFSAFHHLE